MGRFKRKLFGGGDCHWNLHFELKLELKAEIFEIMVGYIFVGECSRSTYLSIQYIFEIENRVGFAKFIKKHCKHPFKTHLEIY